MTQFLINGDLRLNPIHRKILDTINSCKNQEQLKTCMTWVTKIYRKNIIPNYIWATFCEIGFRQSYFISTGQPLSLDDTPKSVFELDEKIRKHREGVSK